ncbi:hypothetical protein [Mesorhizobium sp. M1D.F.Ca.ET.043.01.1.1]|nr:hypothetical protein [Mesorhizobium sp. M1D.F.Ca.ET.043.01.1.1]AZO71122.1 hypothetical protein EJ067_07815 [Mesorhizobium sp. M1D.F.Ca.ET.043.01.1.1]RWA91327.1 MAG: hypothetical protein EOQ32_17655 [Mesorhizobium sp.]
MKRPFALSAMPNSHRSELVVNLVLARSPDNQALTGIADIWRAFQGLAECGGLSGAMHDPGLARALVCTTDLKETTVRASFRDLVVDPAGLFVLANMLHWLHEKIIPLQRATILWPANERVVRTDEPQFPDPWPHYSFELEIGDLIDDIDLEIELMAPQPKAITDRVVDTLSDWLLATHRGGFANEMFKPAESIVFLGPDLMNIEADYVAWFIEAIRADESALDSLLNVLEWIHQNVAPIRSVSLGP